LLPFKEAPVSVTRRRIRRQSRELIPARGSKPWPRRAGCLLLVLAASPALIGALRTSLGRDLTGRVLTFLLSYSGVFALVALTMAVGVGLAGTGRPVLSPGSRVAAQALHRAISFIAVGALGTHIVLEITAQRAGMMDALVPFLDSGRTFYIGLGTLASDLLILIVITGLARRRFAVRWPWAWRAVHALAYLCWPFAILHGLLAGRSAQPYVDWSYGACVAVVGLALVVRFAAATRSRAGLRPDPVPERTSPAVTGAVLTASVRAMTAGQPARPALDPAEMRVLL
jgi:DMSO/TMAO reductase YedYZ heme-binding membrane subunit